MKFNKNSFTAKLVQYSYPNKGLGNNLCTYFWQAFFAYFFSPLIGIHYLFDSNFFRREFKKVLFNDSDTFLNKIAYSMGRLFLIAMCFFMFVIIGNKLHVDNTFIAFIVGIVMFVIVICIGLFFIFLINYSSIYIKKFFNFFRKSRKNIVEKNKKLKENRNNVLIEYIKAKKRKICPIIEWE